jgi:hypothetical protein
MTPELIDYFFNKKTRIFASLDSQEVQLLHTLYDLPEYQYCLPPLPEGVPIPSEPDRTHRRFPVRCPARLRVNRLGVSNGIALTVYECSEKIFCAHAERPLAVGLSGEADVNLGETECCTLPVEIVRLSKHSNRVVMLRIQDTCGEQGKLWLKFVHALSNAPTAADLEEATRFCEEVIPAQS